MRRLIHALRQVLCSDLVCDVLATRGLVEQEFGFISPCDLLNHQEHWSFYVRGLSLFNRGQKRLVAADLIFLCVGLLHVGNGGIAKVEVSILHVDGEMLIVSCLCSLQL